MFWTKFIREICLVGTKYLLESTEMEGKLYGITSTSFDNASGKL